MKNGTVSESFKLEDHGLDIAVGIINTFEGCTDFDLLLRQGRNQVGLKLLLWTSDTGIYDITSKCGVQGHD